MTSLRLTDAVRYVRSPPPPCAALWRHVSLRPRRPREPLTLTARDQDPRAEGGEGGVDNLGQ